MFTVEGDGKVRYFDLEAKKWKKAWAVDLREILAAGTGALEEPGASKPKPAGADEASPREKELAALLKPQLIEVADDLGVETDGLKKGELVSAILAAEAGSASGGEAAGSGEGAAGGE